MLFLIVFLESTNKQTNKTFNKTKQQKKMFQAPAIIIPRVFSNITEERIHHVFRVLDIGIIGRIDMEPHTSSQGENYSCVRIYFSTWKTNRDAQTARNKLLEGKELKFVYDNPWYWKVSAIRNPTRNMAPRAFISRPHIDFGAEDLRKEDPRKEDPRKEPVIQRRPPIAPTLPPAPPLHRPSVLSRPPNRNNSILSHPSNRPSILSRPPNRTSNPPKRNSVSWGHSVHPRSPSTSPPRERNEKNNNKEPKEPEEKRGRGRGHDEDEDKEEEQEDDETGEVPEYNEFSIDYEKIGVIYPKKRRTTTKIVKKAFATATAIADSEGMTEDKKDMCDALYSDIHG